MNYKRTVHIETDRVLLRFKKRFNFKWLGHGDITTTLNIYVHVDNQSKRNMANKLEERFKNSEG